MANLLFSHLSEKGLERPHLLKAYSSPEERTFEGKEKNC